MKFFLPTVILCQKEFIMKIENHITIATFFNGISSYILNKNLMEIVENHVHV